MDPNPKYFLVHNDALLLKIKPVIEKIGYRIPEDIQLIGFDGMDLAADLPLGVSTIVQSVKDKIIFYVIITSNIKNNFVYFV